MSAVVVNPGPQPALASSAPHAGGGHRRGDPFAFAAVLGTLLEPTDPVTSASTTASAKVSDLSRAPVKEREKSSLISATPAAELPTPVDMTTLRAALDSLGQVATNIASTTGVATPLSPNISLTLSPPFLKGADNAAAQVADAASWDLTGATPLKTMVNADPSLGLKSFTQRTHLAAAGAAPLRVGDHRAESLAFAGAAAAAGAFRADAGSGGSKDDSLARDGAAHSFATNSTAAAADAPPALAPLVDASLALDPSPGAIGPVNLSQLPDVIAEQAASLAPPTTDPSKPTPTAPSSVKELEIGLDPADLGPVSVKLRLANGKLSVVIGVAKSSTLSAIEGERDEIARKLGLGPQALGDLVIQSQNNSTSSSEGFHASDSRNGPQADASRHGSRRENGEGARQNRGEDVSSGGDMGSAGRGLGDLIV